MQIYYPCHQHLQASPRNCKGGTSRGRFKTQQGKGHIGQAGVSNLVIYHDKTEFIVPCSIKWKWKLKHHFLELLLNSLKKISPVYRRPFFPIQRKWKSFQYHPIVSDTRIFFWAITHCRYLFMFLLEKSWITILRRWQMLCYQPLNR